MSAAPRLIDARTNLFGHLTGDMRFGDLRDYFPATGSPPRPIPPTTSAPDRAT
jgi:hypothetical protein